MLVKELKAFLRCASDDANVILVHRDFSMSKLGGVGEFLAGEFDGSLFLAGQKEFAAIITEGKRMRGQS